jgi:hypothetical protein
MPLDKILYFFRKAKEFNETNKQSLQKEVYEHRWKNLSLSFIYILGFAAIFGLGLWKKNYFSIFQWYIFTSLVIFFSAIGLFTFLNYLYIIIKKK